MGSSGPLLAPSFKGQQAFLRNRAASHHQGDALRSQTSPPSPPSLGSQDDQLGNKTRAFASQKAWLPFLGRLSQLEPPGIQQASHRTVSLQSLEGSGSHGQHGLPAISFSKKGWIISPYLDLSATASLSSCPQQTRGERNRKEAR